jgi:predicted ATPase
MDIKSIRLQNFKGFKDATIQLKPLTVLIGPNSSGKSCFGQALVALSKSNTSKGFPSLKFDT